MRGKAAYLRASAKKDQIVKVKLHQRKTYDKQARNPVSFLQLILGGLGHYEIQTLPIKDIRRYMCRLSST